MIHSPSPQAHSTPPRKARARGLVVLLACATMLAGAAHAQAPAGAWPSKPIRWVVPYAAGGAADISARLISQQLGTQLGQTVFVDLVPGASGVIGSEQVRRAAADGYTIVMGSSASHGASSITMKNLPFDPVNGFRHVVLLTKLPNVAFVANNSKLRNVNDMFAAIKAQPGLSYGTAGPGSASFLSGALLQVMGKAHLTPVHYKGAGPMVQDVIAGHVPLGFADLTSVLGHAKNGLVRILAVTTSERSASLPDVPTIAESGIRGYESAAWTAVMAPPGTDDAIVRRLNAEFTKALAHPEIKARLEASGSTIAAGTPDDLRQFVQADVEKWKKLAQEANLKFD